VCAVTLTISRRQIHGKHILQQEVDTHDHIVREARIERRRRLDALHLFGGQRNVQRCDVFLELLDFPASDDGEYVRELVQMVRNSHYRRFVKLKASIDGNAGKQKIIDLRAVILSVPTSFAISSRASHTFFSAGVRSQLELKVIRLFSPLSLRRASSALVRIFPDPSTPQGASARPSERAIGMISRSKDRSRTDH
jgi:hypothetical protein